MPGGVGVLDGQDVLLGLGEQRLLGLLVGEKLGVLLGLGGIAGDSKVSRPWKVRSLALVDIDAERMFTC